MAGVEETAQRAAERAWLLMGDLSLLEYQYYREHGHAPQQIVVLAGRDLYRALVRGGPTWRVDEFENRLITEVIATEILLVQRFSEPSWGYNAVVGQGHHAEKPVGFGWKKQSGPAPEG